MEVVQEYPADERTAAARTGLVGPAGVPRGMAGMSNGLGLCRRQLGQQWSCMRACTMKHEEQKPCVESQPCSIHQHGSKQCYDFGDFEELPFGVEDVDVTRAVGEEELPSNVLEVLVSSLKDDSLSRSMVRVVSNEGRVSRLLKELSSGIGSNLISLDISHCHISSTALDSLHNLTSLLSLDLSRNQLTNIIPKSLGNLCNLREIDLSYNSLQNIGVTYLLEGFTKCKSPRLESLSICTSGLSGHLPDQLGQLKHMKHLNLGDNDGSGGNHKNQISGQIPFSIGRLSSLEQNQESLLVDSPLPSSLGQLPKLEELDFSSNFMTGFVTETHFVKLVRLKLLDGGGNSLILRPRLANWIPPFQLQSLDLNSWSLGPQFSLWLQSQRDLIVLDISNTNILSPIPESFWRSFPNLVYLDMSKNHMQGMLNLSGFPALISLDLSSNKFRGNLSYVLNGSFPVLLDLSNNLFVGSLHHFLCSNDGELTDVLNLGNNRLSGVIPECWEKWQRLSFLNLENNNFSGRIPRTLGHVRYIKSLNMHGNKLVGELPASLMNLTSLEILELGGNELAGSIPSWVGTELSLSILNLISNNFVGNIPQELCYLTHIQILDLSDNKLMGDIPRCFNNFSVLSGKYAFEYDQFSYWLTDTKEHFLSDSLVMKGNERIYSTNLKLVKLLDLSSNNLVGLIPSELTTLVELQSLNLSGNHLTGMIPENIGDLKELESFDLSVNKLSGELPMSLSWRIAYFRFLSELSFITAKAVITEFGHISSFPGSVFHNNKHFHEERQALLEFKHHFIDEAGRLASWIRLPGLNGHCRDFHDTIKGIEEASKQQLKGELSPSLLDLKQLKHLDLSCNSFGWIQIPEFIGSLGNLRYLNLSSSNLSGIIPQLGNISQLHTLSLGSFQDWRAESTGVLNMEWLSNLHSLRHLDMSNVDLSKAMDWLQVTNTLPSLAELHFCYSRLLETHLHVPTFNTTSLLLLDLSGNQFTNSLVPQWIFSITSLVSLDLSMCEFNDLIPSISDHSFRNLTSLKWFHVSGNNFMNSSLPNSVGQLSMLEELYFSSNFLTGPQFPLWIQLQKDLVYLNISNTSISSPMPESLCRSFLNLGYLDMSENQMQGTLTLSGVPTTLELLDWSFNSLPNSVGQLSMLEELDFSSNFLTGVVTETHFVKLVRLKVLDGGGNNLILRPRLANWIPPFCHLDSLNLNSWVLGPQFPLWIQLQKDLVYLNISNTSISSPMLESLCRSFLNLGYLDMSENQMQGTLTLSGIPTTLELLDLSFNRLTRELRNVSNGSYPVFLDLSNNLFVGSLHHLLCSDGMKVTNILNLGNNSLSDVIPECWEKWQRLTILNLENNNFSGGFPRTLGQARNMLSLSMRENKLVGKLHSSLMNLTSLEILQLGGNELEGSIPYWLGAELSSLRLLNLRYNNFVGRIPHELCYLKNIHILDVSNNKLFGDIPRCFKNFSIFSGEEFFTGYVFYMNIGRIINKEFISSDSLVMKGHEYIYSTNLIFVRLLDLSSNNLVGHIPSELTTLIKLKSLNLSRNHLTGRIPEKIGDLKELESLDLSMNKLSGELPMSLSSLHSLSSFNVIPEKIGDLKELESLDLSMNKLSGELPMSLSSLNSLSSFNVSYNNLTGRIPSSTQLQSLNESCFVGNKLCGDPLISEPCSRVKTPDTDREEDDGSHGVE
uniref:Putative leucine-rich repeat protein, plant-type n=1 Tax=Tanacetum cinerariifolium TaxID=118510 RepID=A0A6L2K0T4_TANCI|nr:putative leucine-rich repeat protein, plant-type [Tanacetum cinerariifolium]